MTLFAVRMQKAIQWELSGHRQRTLKQWIAEVSCFLIDQAKKYDRLSHEVVLAQLTRAWNTVSHQKRQVKVNELDWRTTTFNESPVRNTRSSGEENNSGFGCCGWVLIVCSYILVVLCFPVAACFCLNVSRTSWSYSRFSLHSRSTGGSRVSKSSDLSSRSHSTRYVPSLSPVPADPFVRDARVDETLFQAVPKDQDCFSSCHAWTPSSR